MAVASGSGAKAIYEERGATKLSSQWRKTNVRQLNFIRSECDGDFELQAMVIGHIEEYKGHKKKLAAAGETVASMSAQRALPLKVKTEDHADDEEDVDPFDSWCLTFFNGIPLPRGQVIFANWNLKYGQALLHYCDNKLFTKQVLTKWTDDTEIYKLIEYAWRLRLFGPKHLLDKVGSRNKKELFDNLKSMYEENGRPLREFSKDIVKGFVDWTNRGVYNAEDQSTTDCIKVIITSKALPNRKAILDAHVFEADPGPYTSIAKNWSIHEAVLTTDSNKYSCIGFFRRWPGS